LWVIQKYIEKPLLIDNKKFDYRCFVIIPVVKPFIALFYHGFVRKTMFDFFSKNVSLFDRKFFLFFILLGILFIKMGRSRKQ